MEFNLNDDYIENVIQKSKKNRDDALKRSIIREESEIKINNSQYIYDPQNNQRLITSIHLPLPNKSVKNFKGSLNQSHVYIFNQNKIIIFFLSKG